MYQIIIQNMVKKDFVPNNITMRQWAKKVLRNVTKQGEVTIRIVDTEEMANLNARFRGKSGTTNVLAFPADLPIDIQLSIPILGDIVLCADVVNAEAMEQNKLPAAHWAHMIVHGCLHLLGYDHVQEKEAQIMESLEINILAELGFNNPYEIKD